MKVIFLDFDGVLNSSEYMKAIGRLDDEDYFVRNIKMLNPEAVQLISNFADEMEAVVVISSSWRVLHDLSEIREMLLARGWGETPIIDITPRSDNGFRGDEVNTWLKHTTHKIAAHVIFDDDGDFHADQPLVQTSWETGLKPEHITKARNIFLGNK